MEIGQDVIPELAPIFSFLNSHSNKLYQEGYFLKLNDLDTRGYTLRSEVSLRYVLKTGQMVVQMWIDHGRNVSLS